MSAAAAAAAAEFVVLSRIPTEKFVIATQTAVVSSMPLT